MTYRYFPGWNQVGVFMANQGLASGSVITAFSVLAVALQRQFETSSAAIMLTMTITILVNNCANPLIGAAMDRYSLRKVLLGGAVCLAAGFIALSFATSIIHVYVVYGTLLAVALGIMGPVSYTTMLPRWFVRLRARATGLAAIGLSMGGFTLPLGLHALIEGFGWRDATRIFATIIIAAVIPMIAFLIIDRPAEVGLYPDGDKGPSRVVETKSTATIDDLPTGTVLKNLDFWVTTLVIGLVVSGAGGIVAVMVPLAISKGFTPAQGALAITTFSAGSFASKILYTIYGDRVKPRAGLAIGLFLFILSSFSFVHASTYSILLTAAVLQGLAIGTMMPLWSYLAALVFGPPHVGRVFGLIMAMTTPMSLAAPPFLGWIYDRSGAYDNGFYIYIGLALTFALFIVRLRMESALPRLATAAD